MLHSRRRFIAALFASLAGTGSLRLDGSVPGEAIIDIHQHTPYAGRPDRQLIRHQRALGVTITVLLPADSRGDLGAGCGGNEAVLSLARELPNEFLHFANEAAGWPTAPGVVRKYLREGARGIGEQKFAVACDSPAMERLAELAGEFRVPLLIHFEEGKYNHHFARFHKLLEKFPNTVFIGHAQTWWGHIDRHYDESSRFSTGAVRPGGLTDQWLREYPNLFADLSGNSGLRALIRDEDHAREFLGRHSRKLLFGSDCNDSIGRGTACTGAQILAAIRRLAPNEDAERRILFLNAASLLGIPFGHRIRKQD